MTLLSETLSVVETINPSSRRRVLLRVYGYPLSLVVSIALALATPIGWDALATFAALSLVDIVVKVTQLLKRSARDHGLMAQIEALPGRADASDDMFELLQAAVSSSPRFRVDGFDQTSMAVAIRAFLTTSCRACLAQAVADRNIAAMTNTAFMTVYLEATMPFVRPRQVVSGAPGGGLMSFIRAACYPRYVALYIEPVYADFWPHYVEYRESGRAWHARWVRARFYGHVAYITIFGAVLHILSEIGKVFKG